MIANGHCAAPGWLRATLWQMITPPGPREGPVTWAIWAGPKMPAATLIEIPDETAPTTPSTPAISSSSALCPAIVASKLEKTRDLPLVGQ